MTEREHRLTKFREAWIDKIDVHGKKVGEWLVKGKDDYNAYCLFCQCPVPISNSGYSQVTQHAKTTKHKVRSEKQSDKSQY